MSLARILIGDLSGKLIAELTPDVGSVNWRISNIGTCKFSISRRDPKATEINLRFGNKVFIEFDNGLPDWGGVIDLPRTWSDEEIEISVYSGEQILGYRTTDKGRYFKGKTIGEIFSSLISDANDAWPFEISAGEIFMGGDTHSPAYHFKPLLEIMQKSLCERISNFEFNVTPYLEGSTIKFSANLYESLGTDKPGIALIQGSNLTPVKLKEQGPIVNAWHLAGEGTSWGASRLISSVENVDSISKYGLREDSKIESGTKDQAALDSQAAVYLEASRNPHNLFTIAAIDREPALFSEYGVGDTISLLAPSVGFGGTNTKVRIIAREYQPDQAVCVLAVEEVIG